jgi:hypothetical protein
MKNMKKGKTSLFLFFIYLACFVPVIQAQDIILKLNGEEIPAKVTEVGADEIKYKKFSNQDGPAYVMSLSEIFMIKYENGEKDLFAKETDTGNDNSAGTEDPESDYALLHIYRQSMTGALIKYDLHLDDDVICHVSNNWKETIKIYKEGLSTLWARTESKAELPIDIQLGEEYYIRCGIKMGIVVGRPQLELVDSTKGMKDLQSIKDKKK